MNTTLEEITITEETTAAENAAMQGDYCTTETEASGTTEADEETVEILTEEDVEKFARYLGDTRTELLDFKTAVADCQKLIGVYPPHPDRVMYGFLECFQRLLVFADDNLQRHPKLGRSYYGHWFFKQLEGNEVKAVALRLNSHIKLMEYAFTLCELMDDFVTDTDCLEKAGYAERYGELTDALIKRTDALREGAYRIAFDLLDDEDDGEETAEGTETTVEMESEEQSWKAE